MRFSAIASVALCLALGACSSQAQTAAPPTKPAAGAELDAGSVRAWLSRIHEAAGRRDFSGTLVVSAGGGVHSARIVHVCNGAERYERIDALDGQPRQIYRQSRVVHTFWPDSRTVLIEQRGALSDFPALLHGGVDRIAEFYELRKLGVDRVAGHEADVLLLLPRDGARFAHRLWAERKTGLLLRAEVLGERGEVLESSAFSELVMGSKLSAESLMQGMPKLDGLRVIRKVSTPVKLESEGWTLRELVPGFQQVSCVKRPMPGEEAGADALQLVFSDGMTYVSLFIEPFVAAKHQKALQTAMGATQTLMRRQGDWWITVMGDVPMPTLQSFYSALERKR
ncbi:MucB/RseB C-terminal domain-containing protein [Roseateles toxinivorans]|uniref:MucB/RseB-like sigma(E) regulatory protein n=1 Tax=Roseateles toxinivorans TaxID=270368 RepID=A0A4R6QN91_9BURK|nr:MucB/RseB C-terminal domain-containing protein [Roseateles toxinivorans]TDP71455.1 MucB/RseB-like sigma(E) regulatory protein [Roseateles toxinivorans]